MKSPSNWTLLYMRRPSQMGGARNGDERSPVHHSMISSARKRTDCGMVSPSVLSVLRLTTARIWSAARSVDRADSPLEKPCDVSVPELTKALPKGLYEVGRRRSVTEWPHRRGRGWTAGS